MKSETKWADVAHYYSGSGISIERTPYDIDQFVTGSVTINEGTHVAQSISVGGHCVFFYEDDRDARGVVTADKYKPILRHRDDMTEAEARKLATLQGWEDYHPSQENYPIDSFFVSDGTLYISQKKNDVVVEFIQMNAEQFHFLISRGFDLFGLIERGEAIRKEVSNERQ